MKTGHAIHVHLAKYAATLKLCIVITYPFLTPCHKMLNNQMNQWSKWRCVVTLLHVDYRLPLHHQSKLYLLIKVQLSITAMLCAKFKDIWTIVKVIKGELGSAKFQVKVFFKDSLYCSNPYVYDSVISQWLYCQLSEQLVLWDFVDVWWLGETQSDIIVVILISIFMLSFHIHDIVGNVAQCIFLLVCVGLFCSKVCLC